MQRLQPPGYSLDARRFIPGLNNAHKLRETNTSSERCGQHINSNHFCERLIDYFNAVAATWIWIMRWHLPKVLQVSAIVVVCGEFLGCIFHVLIPIDTIRNSIDPNIEHSKVRSSNIRRFEGSKIRIFEEIIRIRNYSNYSNSRIITALVHTR